MLICYCYDLTGDVFMRLLSKESRAKLHAWLFNKPHLKRFVHKLVYAKDRTIIALCSLFNPVREDTVLFTCFVGRSYTCSPKAIYEYMLSDPKYAGYKFVWMFRDEERCRKYRRVPALRNAHIVEFKSLEYYKYLVCSKYIVSNYKFHAFSPRRKGQIFLQCWHGTPLKRLGFDVSDDALNARDTRAGLHIQYERMSRLSTYFISPSAFASECFNSAYRLQTIDPPTEIIEKGYPRNDALAFATVEKAREIRERLNLPHDKRIILYAPTFRDNQHTAGLGFTYQIEVDFDRLRERLSDDYIILFRAHYLVASSFDFDKYKGFVYNVSDVDDINDLYICSDLLVTDYSSVFFDYANLRRPIIFYMYDRELYGSMIRGFYIDLAELPGPIVETEADLVDAIIGFDNENYYDERYRAFNAKYNYLDDGHASQRVAEHVFAPIPLEDCDK